MIVDAMTAADMITAAQAEVITSAPAFGGTASQSVAAWYYSNLGKTGVTFNSSRFLFEPGNALPESSELCGGVEAANSRCRTVADNIPNNPAIWCRADVSNKKNISGRLELRSSSGAVLTSEEV
jgi:hypothetical protein